MKKAKIPNKLRKIIRDSVQQYAWLLGFSHYKADIHYMDDDSGDDVEGFIYASANTDIRYLSVKFRIYPILVRNWKKDKNETRVKEIIAHEVSHIATQPMRELILNPYKTEGEARDVWENLTEVVGRLLFAVDKLKK